ncbi:hypothetical protein EI94DRAFT_1818093 [Lactarius quietus]|nr:hypothetical protein EI94DRAFT_1818093 [Lactarius quietus]
MPTILSPWAPRHPQTRSHFQPWGLDSALDLQGTRLACPPSHQLIIPSFSQVIFFSLLATITAIAIKKSTEYANKAMDVDLTPSHSVLTVAIGAMPEPTQPSLQDPQDGAMNADPTQSHSPPLRIPLPGNLVDGKCKVVWIDLRELMELCKGFNLMRTGTVVTLKECLQDFSKNPQEWDVVLLPGAHKRHCGPQDSGTLNGPKKTQCTKKSTQQCELLFNGTTDSMGLTSQPCLPMERSKDMHTAVEKEALLAWADRCCALNEYKRTHPDETGDDEPALAVDTLTMTSLQVSKRAAINKCFQQMQAEIARLTMALASASLAPPCPTVVDGPATAATAQREPATVATTANATTVTKIASTNVTTAGAAASTATLVTQTQKRQNALLLEAKRSRPTRNLFCKGDPQLLKMWDDSSVDWDPIQAVLHIQGEPIALKYWKSVYCYGKAGQWAGTKKLWYQWQDITTSWQELTEEGFWQKYSSPDGRHMAYTTICETMQQERIAANHINTERAKEEYGDQFSAVFEYRRGGERLVMNKEATIAKHYCSLHSSSAGPSG